jgi:DNA-binding MarR family transcriptional regulator
MENKTIDTIIENLFYVLPIIHKKLLKIDPPDISPEIRLSHLHVAIMATISESKLPISEIAKKFLIPKPRMTLLINQLVKAGIVERKMSTIDRRITDISLSEKGKVVFRKCDDYLKANAKEKLSYLSGTELEELSLLLSKLRRLGAKLNTCE